MKIIRCDNFNRESVAEDLVAENITSKYEATIMLEALQSKCNEYSPNWYKLCEDDYNLWRGMEELV